MKKLLSVILALVMILSLSTVAFAETTEEPVVPSDVETVTLKKYYKLTNDGTVNPAETFTFTEPKCIDVTDAAEGVTTATAPNVTIASVAFEEGTATVGGTLGNITLNLPEYNSVGIYTYTFKEVNNKVAGVTYRESEIKLVVTVIQGADGKIRVAAVHTESEGGKSDSFDNTYSAGSLSVTKEVTGNLGDQSKLFDVTVTFTAPDGETVKSDITYSVAGGAKQTIDAGEGWTGSREVKIQLKHGDTVKFDNIPYGVTYTVEESDYTGEHYDRAQYDNNQKGTIDDPSVTTKIINNKTSEIDTGIVLDSMPYVLLLAVAAMGLAVLLTKKRASRED